MSPLPRVTLGSLLGLALLMPPSSAQGEICTEGWSLKTGRSVVLYPDLAASYLSYTFIREPGEALRFTGPFAKARFQSFTLYEDEGGLLVNKLLDQGIEADPGSQNPFDPDVPRDVDSRNYTVIVAPEGSAAASLPNAIVVPPENTRLRMIMRVYLPDDGSDALGGATPEIEAINAETLSPISCPEQHRENGADVSSAGGVPVTAGDIHLYRVAGTGAYPSYETSYLVSALDPAGGDVALLHFTAPTFPDTSSSSGGITNEEDVRYWSLCLSRLNTTTTSACVADLNVNLNAQGEAWVAFAPPTPANIRAARRNRVTLVPWIESVEDPVILYRNHVVNPDFPNGTDSVPAYDPDLPPSEQWGEVFIGDYAPRGVMCSSEEFQANKCGL